MNDIFNRRLEITDESFINVISGAVREKSKQHGGIHERCVDCNRKLTDEHSRLIGRGPICRAQNPQRFTIIPDVWGTGPNQLDRSHTLDRMEQSLGIDFAVLVARSYYEIVKRSEKAPYDWEILSYDDDEFLKLSLLDEHEYVQHDLVNPEVEPDFGNWNTILILSELETGMVCEEREILPRQFESWEEVDVPICRYHLENWPNNKWSFDKDSILNLWHDCPHCNYNHDTRDNIVELGELKIEDFVFGGRNDDGLLVNPYPPPRNWTSHGNLSEPENYSNARVRCGYFTKPMTEYWHNYHHLDYQNNNGIWSWRVDDGYGNHPDWRSCDDDGGIGWAPWLPDSTEHEREIWTYIVGSIRLDLKIEDEYGWDDEFFRDCLPEWVEGLHRDEKWSQRMREWFDSIADVVNDTTRDDYKGIPLRFIQQIFLVQCFAPWESDAGTINGGPQWPTFAQWHGWNPHERYTAAWAFESWIMANDDLEFAFGWLFEGYEELIGGVIEQKKVQTTTPPTN